MLPATSTVAVSAPENGTPVPAVDKIAGLTTTMYAIVKNVVTPPITSAESGQSMGTAGSGTEVRMLPSPRYPPRAPEHARTTSGHRDVDRGSRVADRLCCARAGWSGARSRIGAAGRRPGRDGHRDPRPGRRP